MIVICNIVVINILHYDDLLRRLLGHSSQTSDGRAHGDSTWCCQGVGTSGNRLTARTARPDSDALALDGVLAAEDASVCGMLRNLNLSDQLTEGGTVPCSVLSRDSDLLGALSHLVLSVVVLAVVGIEKLRPVCVNLKSDVSHGRMWLQRRKERNATLALSDGCYTCGIFCTFAWTDCAGSHHGRCR